MRQHSGGTTLAKFRNGILEIPFHEAMRDAICLASNHLVLSLVMNNDLLASKTSNLHLLFLICIFNMY